MKHSDESLRQMCESQNLTYIGCISKLNPSGRKRERYVQFICNEHSNFGVQERKIYDFQRQNKICKYCNHSKLKDVLQDEIDRVNGTVKIVSKYKNWNTKVDCECRTCGNKWSTVVSVLLYGSGCPKCGKIKASKNEMRDRQSIVDEIESKNPNIKVIGEYSGYGKPIECVCLIDGFKWDTSSPAHLIDGTAGCPECTRKRMYEKFALPKDVFEKRIKESYNGNIEIVGDYVNANTPIEFYCNKHDNYFKMKPRSLMYKNARGCPQCAQTSGETKMNNILNRLGYHIDPQHTFDDCCNINKLRFDGYDEDHNIAFEYQGEQHYRPVDFAGRGDEWAKRIFEDGIKRDNIKREYCKQKGIHLIEVPYWEFDNMDAFLIDKLSKINNTT